jgi:hypothetical protein
MYSGLSDAPAKYQGRPNGAAPNGATAVPTDLKVQRALERGYIQLFLSHKQKDQKSAAEIREVLQTLAGRLQVFMSENIAKGADWQEQIEQQLHQSDWFVLLFTGIDDDDWSWCHHEAGIFRGSQGAPDVHWCRRASIQRGSPGSTDFRGALLPGD